jgi:hypothetical protein
LGGEQMTLTNIHTTIALVQDYIDTNNIASLVKAFNIIEDAIEEFYMLQELKESKENVK